MDPVLKVLDKDLMLELECPVCMEYLTPPIVICENGHSICNTCKSKLTSCPNCRKPFLNVRNLALESLSRAVVPTRETSEAIPKSYKCPFAQISNEDCSWNGKLKNMKKHLRNIHDNPRDSHSSEGSFNVILTSISETRHYRKAQFVNDEVFYVTWEIKDGNFYCAVLNIGSESNASNFKYEFSLSCKNGLKKINMIFPTKSIIDDLNTVLKPGQCVLLHYDTVIEFLDQNKNLSCDFEIKSTSSTKHQVSSSVVRKNQQMTKNGEASSANFSHNGREFPVFHERFDDFRGRGCRGGRRGRGGRPGRGGRWWGEDPRRGRGFYNNSKIGWSMSDLHDEAHYKLEEWKVGGESASQQGDKSVFELIARSIEGNAASRRQPSISSQRSESSVSSLGSVSSGQFHRMLNETAKERNISQSSLNSSASGPSKVTRNSQLKQDASESKKSPPVQMPNEGKPTGSYSSQVSSETMNRSYRSPYGNTSSELYPKLFSTKNAEEKPVETVIHTLEGDRQFDTAFSPDTAQSAKTKSQMKLTAEVKPTAPKPIEQIWRCTLCNNMVTEKGQNHLGFSLKPPGNAWFCNMCGHYFIFNKKF